MDFRELQAQHKAEQRKVTEEKQIIYETFCKSRLC